MSSRTTSAESRAGVAIVWRILAASVLLVISGVVISQQSAYRGFESIGVNWLIGTFSTLPSTVTPGRATVWTGASPHIWGLVVTPECSSALLAVGFMVVAAALIVLRGRQLHVVLLGAAVAIAVVVLANLARICVVIAATTEWGSTGFSWSHTYVGTMITLAGLVLAALMFIKTLGRGRPHRRPQP